MGDRRSARNTGSGVWPVGVVVAILVAVGAGRLAGQETGQRWVSYGVGYGSTGTTGTYVGSADPSSDGVGTGDYNALGAFLQVGTIIRGALRLGGGADVMKSSAAGRPLTSDVRLVVAFYLPRGADLFTSSRFLVTLAPGFSHYQGTAHAPCCPIPGPDCAAPYCPPAGPTPESVGGNGWSMGAGLAAETRIDRHVSITSGVDYLFGDIGTLTAGGRAVATSWRESVFEFRIGLTYY